MLRGRIENHSFLFIIINFIPSYPVNHEIKILRISDVDFDPSLLIISLIFVPTRYTKLSFLYYSTFINDTTQLNAFKDLSTTTKLLIIYYSNIFMALNLVC